jgi:drug/metabolite transporter (DMT)-like permease
VVDAPVPIPGATQRDQRAGTGYAMALCGAVLFAVNGAVSKVALTGSDLSAVDYTQLRTAGGFVVLALVLAVFARDRLRMTLSDVPFFVFYGMFSFALIQWLYFVAIEHLPIGIALLIQFCGIVLVALWARLVWKANVRPRVWAALSLTLVGLALVSEFWLGWTLDTVGVLAAVGGAIVLAVYLLAGERAVKTRDPLTVLCFSLLFAALVWSVVQPWWNFPFEELTEETSLLGNLDDRSAPVWTLALWTIVLGTIVPFALTIGALRHLAATRVGITMTFEPVVATVVAWAWLGETLSVAQLAGGGVVLLGILLAQTAR